MYNPLEFPWKLFFHKWWDRQREKHVPHCWEKERIISAVWYLVVWITLLFFFSVLWNINLTNAPVERSRIKLYGPKPLNLQSTVAYCVAMFTGTWQFVFNLMQILRSVNWICTLCCLCMWFYHVICYFKCSIQILVSRNKPKTKLNKIRRNYQQS